MGCLTLNKKKKFNIFDAEYMREWPFDLTGKCRNEIADNELVQVNNEIVFCYKRNKAENEDDFTVTPKHFKSCKCHDQH